MKIFILINKKSIYIILNPISIYVFKFNDNFNFQGTNEPKIHL